MEKDKEVGCEVPASELYQQIMCYQETVNKRFQDLETLRLASRQLKLLKMRTSKKKKVNLVQSRSECQNEVGNDLLEPLYHLKLNSPKFDEMPGEDKEDWHYEEIICIALGLEGFLQPKKNSEDGNHGGARKLECTSYFKTLPRKIKSDDKGNLDEEFQMPEYLITSKNLNESMLQPASSFISICQELIGGAELIRGEPLQVEPLEQFHKDFQKDDPSSENGAQYRALADKDEWKNMDTFSLLLLDISSKDTNKPHYEEIPSIIFTNMREVVEVFFYKTITEDSLTTTKSDGLGSLAVYCENNVLIFDPGGQVKNKQSKVVNNNFKDMIRSEIKLEEVVMKTSVGSQFRYWQDMSLNFLAIKQLLNEPYQLHMKVFIIEMGNPTRLQGQIQKVQKENDGFDKIVSEIPQHGCKQVRQLPSTKVTKINKGQVHGLNLHIKYLHSEEIVDEACMKTRKCMVPFEVTKGKDQQRETQICTCEESNEMGELPYIHYIQQGKTNNNVICASQLSKKPNNIGKNVMIIFDPGGYESTEVFKMVKEMFGQDVELDEVAVIIPVCGQLEQLQGQDIQKVCEESSRIDKIISEINQH